MPESTRTAAEVAAMLEDGQEIAFLDVREIVPFGTGHPLLATHLALGHIECEIAGLVPRRDTRLIVKTEVKGSPPWRPTAGSRASTRRTIPPPCASRVRQAAPVSRAAPACWPPDA